MRGKILSVLTAICVVGAIAGIVGLFVIRAGNEAVNEDGLRFVIIDGELYSSMLRNEEYVTLVKCDDLSWIHPTWEELGVIAQDVIFPGDDDYEGASYACWRGVNL